jgi:hypothetical protein
VNLLFHELIETERRKDKLAAAHQYRLVNQFKQEQTRFNKPCFGSSFDQILKSGRDWLVKRGYSHVFNEQ